MNKICSKCGIEKDESLFKRGRGSICKECINVLQRIRRNKNREYINNQAKQYRRKKWPVLVEKENLLKIGLRKCKICNNIKREEEFYIRKGSKKGLHCRECHKQIRRKYYQKNKQSILNHCKKYVSKNKERKSKYYKEWRIKNMDNVVDYNSKYRQKNIDSIKEKRNKKYQENKKQLITYREKYSLDNDYKNKRKEYFKNNSKELLLPYVVSQLKRIGFSKKAIDQNPQLIENYQIVSLHKRFKNKIKEISDFGVCIQCNKLTPKAEFKKNAKGNYWCICKSCQKEKYRFYNVKYKKEKS